MWQQPKTDWKSDDFFNIQDYNRIKNNIGEIYSMALELRASFPFDEMGEDKTYADYGFYADEINRFEKNVDHICMGTLSFLPGVSKEFYDNQPFIDYKELNRIEEAIRMIHANILGSMNGRNTLAFILNGGFF